MIRLKALTGDESDGSESESASVQKPCTKEAQEADAISLYYQGLLLVKEGQLEQAKDIFLELLEYKLIKEALPLTSVDEGLVHPGLALKYSVYKNLATIALQSNQLKDALEYYLQAVNIDSTDVSVWYKIGSLAVQSDNISLAKHAFQQCLSLNPNHWPSLDNLIPVLFAMCNYEECLVYLAQALERDPGYVEGKVFLQQILKEQPSLNRYAEQLFINCSDSIYDSDSDTEGADVCIEEALALRIKKQELAKQPPIPSIKPKSTNPIRTWKTLGEVLLEIYNTTDKALQDDCHHGNKSTYSFAREVDLTMIDLASGPEPSNSVQKDDNKMEGTHEPPADGQTPVETDMEVCQSSTLTDTKITQTTTATTSTTSNSVVMSDGSVTPKRGKKRKYHPISEDFIGKRRSARVRNTTHKKDEAIDYHQLLSKFLPLSLLEVQDMEDDSSSLPTTIVTSKSCQVAEHLVYPTKKLSEDEEQEVGEFIERHKRNGGVIALLRIYLIQLANRADRQWPPSLSKIYTDGYSKVRKHFSYPDCLCKEATDELVRDLAMMCLVNYELKLEQSLCDKDKSSVLRENLQNRSPGDKCGNLELGDDVLGQYTHQDMMYMSGLTVLRDLLADLWLHFTIRVYWLKARYLFLLGDMVGAVDCFCMTKEYLKLLSDTEEDPSIMLPNCDHDNLVTFATVDKQLESLEHCQSLEEVQKLYELGQYEQVVELLLKTFSQEQISDSSRDDRSSQLLLLQESLLRLEDYKRCVIWSEVSLNETLKRYFSATSLVKQKWLSTLVQLMEGLDRCFSLNSKKALEVPSRCLVRLTHSLIRLIQKTMDTPMSAMQMSIPTMLPWILIYRLIKNEEMCVGYEKFVTEADPMPCSLTFLSMAHECLGRRSWCIQCDGQLLHFMLDILLEVFADSTSNQPLPYDEDLRTAIEQCIYCLYNHPSKRTKAKHLEDHNTEPLTLEWSRAVQVFDYFKPTSMPEYDSYRTSTVSAELENFLRRVSALVPSSYTPPITVERMTAYIEGGTSKPPTLSEGSQVNLPVVQELFYLLADYYFKNKEPMKAIKFYIEDLCYNPVRFDSWAGMALARAIRLEQKLASHELRPEISIQKPAVCTLRCFKRALQLDPSSSKLWIEYGSIAYQLHSFASRQCKQKDWHMYTDEQLELAASNKQEMLELACNCYSKAAIIEEGEEGEEQWLHHYMLGKIREKQGQQPQVYLEHYKTAARYLHEDKAKYPRKITFYHTAPHLAIEALEMHYRLHVSILKYLLIHCDEDDLPLDMLESYIKDAACGPFATCQELTSTEMTCSDDGSHSNMSVMPVVSEVKRKRRVHQTIPDHTYSKEKQTSESELSSHGSDLHGSSQDSTCVGDVLADDKLTTAHQPAGDKETHLSDQTTEKGSSDHKDETHSADNNLEAKSFDHKVEAETCLDSMEAQLCDHKVDDGVCVHKTEAEDSHHKLDADVCNHKTEADSSDQKMEVESSNHEMEPEITTCETEVGDSDQQTEMQYSTNATEAETCDHSKDAQLSDHVMEVEMESIVEAESSNHKESNQLSALKTENTDDKAMTESLIHKTSNIEDADPENDPTLDKQDGDISVGLGSSSETHCSINSPIVSSFCYSIDTPILSPSSGYRFPSYGKSCKLTSSVSDGSRLPGEKDRKLTGDTAETELSVCRKSDSENNDPENVCALTAQDCDIALGLPVSSGSQCAMSVSVASSSCSITDTPVLSPSYKKIGNLSSSLAETPQNYLEGGGDELSHDLCSHDESPPTLVSCDSHMDNTSHHGSSDVESIDLEPPVLDEAFLGPSHADSSWPFTPKPQRDTALNAGHRVEPEEDAVEGDKDSLVDSQDVNPIYVDGAGDEKPPKGDPSMTPVTPVSSDDAATSLASVSSSLGSDLAGISSASALAVSGPECIIMSASVVTGTSAGNDSIDKPSDEPMDKSSDNTRSKVLDEIVDKPLDMTLDNTLDEPSINLLDKSSNNTLDKTSDKTVEKQSDKSMDEPLDEIIDKCSDEKMNKTSDKIINEPSDETVIKPSGKTMDKPSIDIMEKPLNETMEKPLNETMEKPSDKTMDEPSDNIMDKPSDMAMNDQSDKTMDKTTDKPSDKTMDKPSDKPSDKTMDEPSDKTMDEPSDKTIDKPSDKTMDKPSDKTMDEPSDKTMDKSSDKAVDQEARDRKKQYRDLIASCVSALCLCLQRLPQHHKSLYRLAYVYMYCPHLKNAEFAQDLLLGNPNWSSLSHMPCPGMFQERKQNNFFQGLWKIPIDEIDRSGSFAAHLTVSITLLYEVLEVREQGNMLYHIHLQLNRTPDTGRKYIRDCDRVYLAKEAYKRCVDVLEKKISRKPSASELSKQSWLMEVYRMWQHGVKQRLYVQKLNKLFANAYRTVHNITAGDDAVVLDEAIKYCQQKSQINRPFHDSRRESHDMLQNARLQEITKLSARTDTIQSDGSKKMPSSNQRSTSQKGSQPVQSHYQEESKTTPLSGELAAEEMLAQYWQNQLGMMSTLAQLYGQSNSMAYASNLQAFTSGLYEGFNPYGMSALGAMSSSLAQTLLQSSSLGAGSSSYPYPGYPMTAEMLAALSSGLSPPAGRRGTNVTNQPSTSQTNKPVVRNVKGSKPVTSSSTTKHGSMQPVSRALPFGDAQSKPRQISQQPATSPLGMLGMQRKKSVAGAGYVSAETQRMGQTVKSLGCPQTPVNLSKSALVRPSGLIGKSGQPSGLSSTVRHSGPSSTTGQNKQPRTINQARHPGISIQGRQPATMNQNRQLGIIGQNRHPGAINLSRQAGTISQNRQPGAFSQNRQPGTITNNRQGVNISQVRQPGMISPSRHPGTITQGRRFSAPGHNRQPVAVSQARQPGANTQMRHHGIGTQDRQYVGDAGKDNKLGRKGTDQGTVTPKRYCKSPEYEANSPDSDVVIISSSQDSSD